MSTKYHVTNRHFLNPELNKHNTVSGSRHSCMFLWYLGHCYYNKGRPVTYW